MGFLLASPFSRARLLVAIVFTAAFKLAIAAKIVYFTEVAEDQFVKSTLIREDSGVITSSIVFFEHPELKNETWYKIISKELDEIELLRSTAQELLAKHTK